jgi:hypothetical protein
MRSEVAQSNAEKDEACAERQALREQLRRAQKDKEELFSQVERQRALSESVTKGVFVC